MPPQDSRLILLQASLSFEFFSDRFYTVHSVRLTYQKGQCNSTLVLFCPKGIDKCKGYPYNIVEMKKEEMLELRLKGLTHKQIAERAGISRQRVQQILAPYKLSRYFAFGQTQVFDGTVDYIKLSKPHWIRRVLDKLAGRE